MKVLSGALAVVFTLQNGVFLHAAETNFWKERHTQLAALPASMPAPAPVFSSSHLAGHPVSAVSHVVPSWMQRSLSPFAAINDIRLSPNKTAKTVLLFQDAHLHSEAQANSAGALSAIAAELEKKGETLLVGLEAAPAGAIDLSVYAAYPHRKALHDVAQAFMEKHVINGAELAAMGYGADRAGALKLPMNYIGVENWDDYNANVKAFRDAHELQKKAASALEKTQLELAAKKKKFYDDALARFDAKTTGYEDGSLGVSDYALYLDSIVPPSTGNTKELINAILLEKTIDFAKVERQRTQLLESLLRKLSPEESSSLLSASALLQSGHVSSAEFYGFIKNLTAKKGVSLARFPDMNLYIQYVVKSEGIDSNVLLSELRAWENTAGAKLAKTPDQSNLLAETRQFRLGRKLVKFELTEEEWKEYAASPAHIANESFEDFYRIALKRNDDMTVHMAAALTKSDGQLAVLVAGGFHAQGLREELAKAGFNVVTVSPKITKPSDGPSSLDLLASNRAPIDQLFVGERLFLDVARQIGTPALSKMALGAADVVATGRENDVARPAKPGENPDLTAGDQDIKFKGSGTGKPYPFEEAIKAAVNKLGVRDAMKRFESLFITDSAYMTVSQMNESTIRQSGMANLLARAKQILTKPTPSLLYEDDLMTWVRIVVNRLRQVGAYEHEGSLFNRLKSVGLNAKTILDVVMPILLNMAEGDLRFLLGMRLVPAARMHEMANIVSVVRMGMGLQKVSVSVNVYTGDLLAQMAQISRQGVTYVINVSEEYLNTHVINKERVAAVMKAGQFKHVEDAKKKLIEWYFEEELIEGIWRYHDLDPAKDAAYQKKAHDAWQTLGLNVIPNLQLQKPEYFKDKPGTRAAELVAIDAERADKDRIFTQEAHAYFKKAFPDQFKQIGPQPVPAAAPVVAGKKMVQYLSGPLSVGGTVITDADGKSRTEIAVFAGAMLAWKGEVPGEVTIAYAHPGKDIYIFGTLKGTIYLYRKAENGIINRVVLRGDHDYAITKIEVNKDQTEMISTDASGPRYKYYLDEAQPVGLLVPRGVISLPLLTLLAVPGVVYFSATSLAFIALIVIVSLTAVLILGLISFMDNPRGQRTNALLIGSLSAFAGLVAAAFVPMLQAWSTEARLLFVMAVPMLATFVFAGWKAGAPIRAGQKIRRMSRLFGWAVAATLLAASPAMAGDGSLTLLAMGPALPVWVSFALGVWFGKKIGSAIKKSWNQKRPDTDDGDDHGNMPSPNPAPQDPQGHKLNLDLSKLDAVNHDRVTILSLNQALTKLEKGEWSGHIAHVLIFMITLLTASSAMAGETASVAAPSFTANGSPLVYVIGLTLIAFGLIYRSRAGPRATNNSDDSKKALGAVLREIQKESPVEKSRPQRVRFKDNAYKFVRELQSWATLPQVVLNNKTEIIEMYRAIAAFQDTDVAHASKLFARVQLSGNATAEDKDWFEKFQPLARAALGYDPDVVVDSIENVYTLIDAANKAKGTFDRPVEGAQLFVLYFLANRVELPGRLPARQNTGPQRLINKEYNAALNMSMRLYRNRPDDKQPTINDILAVTAQQKALRQAITNLNANVQRESLETAVGKFADELNSGVLTTEAILGQPFSGGILPNSFKSAMRGLLEITQRAARQNPDHKFMDVFEHINAPFEKWVLSWAPRVPRIAKSTVKKSERPQIRNDQIIEQAPRTVSSFRTPILEKAAAAAAGLIGVLANFRNVIGVTVGLSLAFGAKEAVAADLVTGGAQTIAQFSFFQVIFLSAMAAGAAVLLIGIARHVVAKTRQTKKPIDVESRISRSLNDVRLLFWSLDYAVPVPRLVSRAELRQRGIEGDIWFQEIDGHYSVLISRETVETIESEKTESVRVAAESAGLTLTSDEVSSLAFQVALIGAFLSQQNVPMSALEKAGFSNTIDNASDEKRLLQLQYVLTLFLLPEDVIARAEKLLLKLRKWQTSANPQRLAERFEVENGVPLKTFSQGKSDRGAESLLPVQKLTVDERFKKPVALHFARLTIEPNEVLNSQALRNALHENSDGQGLLAQLDGLGIDGLDIDARLYGSANATDNSDLDIGNVPALRVINFPNDLDAKRAAQYLLQALEASGDQTSPLAPLNKEQFTRAMKEMTAVQSTRIAKRGVVYLDENTEKALKEKMKDSAWDGDISAEVTSLMAQRPDLQKVSIYADPTRPLSVHGVPFDFSVFFLIPVEVIGLEGQVEIYLLGAKQA